MGKYGYFKQYRHAELVSVPHRTILQAIAEPDVGICRCFKVLILDSRFLILPPHMGKYGYFKNKLLLCFALSFYCLIYLCKGTKYSSVRINNGWKLIPKTSSQRNNLSQFIRVVLEGFYLPNPA